MDSHVRSVLRLFPDLAYSQDFSFRQYTTVGVGGFAPCACYPKSASELAELVRVLHREGIPYCVLGNGSNVLAADAGFGGVAVITRRACALRTAGERIFAESGAQLAAVLAEAVNRGFGGAAFLCGIPATVGGAIFMNAGAGGQYMAELVASVTALIDGRAVRLSAKECDFAYKNSIFMKADSCILSAEFVFKNGDMRSILSDIDCVKKRRAALPTGRSMGCVFRNPRGASAGALIERAGCKGLCCGDAFVSERHANFMINRGNATAQEFVTLIESVRARVRACTGIRLNEEIRYIGVF